MINKEFYMNSKLMVRGDFTDKYRDIAIKNTICKEHPIHMHDCVEIIYVLRGSVECKTSFYNYMLRGGEFIVINAFELHSIKAITESAAISYIHISNELFAPDEGFIAWWADSFKFDDEKYNAQVENIKKLIYNYHKSAHEHVIMKCVENILNVFRLTYKVEYFKPIGSHDLLENSEYDMDRISNVYLFLYQHCNEKLTLEQMANELSVSKYHFSHFLKKTTGVSAIKYLNLNYSPSTGDSG